MPFTIIYSAPSPSASPINTTLTPEEERTAKRGELLNRLDANIMAMQQALTNPEVAITLQMLTAEQALIMEELSKLQ